MRGLYHREKSCWSMCSQTSLRASKDSSEDDIDNADEFEESRLNKEKSPQCQI